MEVIMYKQAAGVVAREVAGEHLLMPLHQTGVDLQKVYLLNETAQAVWELLAQARDLDALVAALAEEYEVDEEDLRKDVQELLDDLVQRGLVVQP